MTLHAHQSRRGLTMIEVVISSMIVGLLLVSVLTASGGVVQHARRIADRSRGLALAQRVMARVRDVPATRDLHVLTSTQRTQAGFAFNTAWSAQSLPNGLWRRLDDLNGWTAAPEAVFADLKGDDWAGFELAVRVTKLANNVRRVKVTVTRFDRVIAEIESLRSEEIDDAR